MLSRKSNRCMAVGGAMVATLSLSSVASAYNNDTHFKIADLAWQVMRAASDRNFRQHVKWTTVPDDTTFDYPDEVGSCSVSPLCTNNPPSQQQWTEYIQKLGPTIRRLNRVRNEVPTPASCAILLGNNTFMADFASSITSAFRDAIFINGSVESNENCDLKQPEWDGIYTSQAVADPVTQIKSILVLPDDGFRRQGLAFGYHAQQRDNEWQDTRIMTEPITGHILDATSEASRLPLKVVLAALICAYEWISSGNTDTCEERADHILDKVDPTHFLRSLIGGPDLAASGAYTGLWHFINVRQGIVHDYYDDKPGMYYQEGGPEEKPGVIDHAIDIGSHILQLVIDADGSFGPDRYQIFTSEDGQQATKRREHAFAVDAWTSQLLSDTIFEPLDNFAQYGWATYQADAASGKWGAAALSWPLHAIGDATVPQHVTGTTSWGHRPYEEWVQHNWDKIMFERCEIDGSLLPFPCDDNFLKMQIGQARRILQWGLYFTQFTANTTGVRPFVEAVAQTTLDTVTDNKSAWPFCDACSFSWQIKQDAFQDIGIGIAELTQFLGDINVGDPEGHYDQYAPNVQNLVEMAAGATIAFLMKSGEGVCTDLAGACTGDASCCSQKCDATDGKCCRNIADHCWDSTECCAGTQCNADGVCCAQASSTCSKNDDCCKGKCNIANGQNTGQCCSADLGQACTANADCCDGSCVSGVCCQTSLGASCTNDPSCCAGPSGNKCSDVSTCCNVGSGQACGNGDVCCRGTCTNGNCCVRAGATCAATSDCCSGSSCAGGKCCVGIGSSCSGSDQCCNGTCQSGVCLTCFPDQTACTDNSQCCSGTCFNGVCKTIG